MNRPYHHIHGEIHPIIDLHLVSRLEMKPLNCLLHSSLMSVSDYTTWVVSEVLMHYNLVKVCLVM